jgi:glycerol-3-phosphate acyltransferase PlsY
VKILVIVLSYFIGSISTAYILVKLMKGIDIRTVGSKNAGATNVQRVLGTGPALLVFCFDALKGILAVMIGRITGDPTVALWCGIAAVVGHNWPLFFGLRGGKGTATTLGVLWAVMPNIASIITVVGIAAIAITRYVSLGSVLGAPLLLILTIITGKSWNYIIFSFILMSMTLYRHRENIMRLLEGRESRLGQKLKRVK